MTTNFPTSLDALTNPTGVSSLTSPDHAGQHSDANDAIEALESKVGVDGSAVTTSLDYKVTNGILGALNVDAGTLVVDAINDRVGVGTNSPTEKLDVAGNIALTGSIVFEGAIPDNFETTLSVTNPTTDNTLTLPNASGTVALFGTAVSLIDTQTFVSSTTYVMPAGAKFVIVEGCGGGGGGGGGPRNNTIVNGGTGGSGAPRVTKTIPVTNGASYTVTIGAGGAGGAGYIANQADVTGTSGVNGGISRFGTLYFSGGFGSIAGVTGQGHLISGEVPIASNPSSNYLGSGGLGVTLTTKFGRNSNSAGGGGGGGLANPTVGSAGGAYFDDLSLVIVNSGSVAGLIIATSGNGAAGGAVGTAGTNGSTRQGGGGGGGRLSATLNAGNGGNGGAGGGGGGGGGGLQVTTSSNTAASGTGGTGGTGEIKIWVYG